MIMGSLNLDNLKNTGKVDTGYTYVDLHLDIEQATVPTKMNSDYLQGKDIKVDYDVDAIMNSLNNIFKTVPGERFLVPTFGANLRRYLFEPVSQPIANQIGSEILRAIEAWEPRVTVDRILVEGDPENHQYDVTIIITINALRQQVTFNSILNQNTDVEVRNLTRVCPTQ
jgi:phage baseplate assembly protein W